MDDPQPLQQQRTAAPQSRFLEGSMNDRASHAPPPSFLGSGPEELATYEKQFDMDFQLEPLKSSTNTRPATKSRASFRNSVAGIPGSNSCGSSTSSNGKGHRQTASSSSFLAPLLNGVRDKFSLSRKKSSQTINAVGGSDMKEGNGMRSNIGTTNTDGGNADDIRPSRNEILSNYHTLVANGFFGNHAIQSTRYAPPGQMRQSMPPSQHAPPPPPSAENDMMLPPHTSSRHIFPDSFAQRSLEEAAMRTGPRVELMPESQQQPPLAISGQRPVSFSSSIRTVSQEKMPPPPAPIRAPPSRPLRELTPTPAPKHHQHEPPVSCLSIPYTSTRAMAETSRGRPPLSLARFSLDSARRSFDSPLRGIKRPYDDVEMGGVEGTGLVGQDGDTTEGTESGARKVLKKLRKSASRISMDMGKSRARNGTDDDSASTTGRPFASSSLRRSFSFRLGGGNGTAETTNSVYLNGNDSNSRGNSINWAHNLAAVTSSAFLPTIHNTAPSPVSLKSNMERNKLKKREIRDRRERRTSKSPGRRRSTSRPATADSNADSFMTTASSTSAGTAPETFLPHAQFVPYPVGAGTYTRSQGESLDGGSMEGIEFVAPSFHFPGRVKPGNPLQVVPDPNRGIPQVPNIPTLFKHDQGTVTLSSVDENQSHQQQQQQQQARTRWGFGSRRHR